MSIILGIDPGSRVTGFGILQSKASQLKVITYGVIQMQESASFAERMRELGESLVTILDRYNPDIIALEKIFLGKNVDSAFKLGHARGVVMYEAARRDIIVSEYATRVVKKSITGRGGASKEEVQLMVERLLKIPKVKRLDASDALALAIHQAYMKGR